MSVTASVTHSLQVVSTDLPANPIIRQYQKTVTLEDMKGPSPGAITATVVGVEPDLSELTLGGFCTFLNQSSTDGNLALVGIWDGDSFFPLFEVPPGEESGEIRLSRYLGQEMEAGTGTVSSAGSLMIKMLLESAVVVIYGMSR